jgi:hypothetical protein
MSWYASDLWAAEAWDQDVSPAGSRGAAISSSSAAAVKSRPRTVSSLDEARVFVMTLE